MKLDFDKIIKKNKNNIMKPLFNNNYLFHYLIYTRNLKLLKKYKHPIHIENNDMLNGFHLASKEYNKIILCHLIKKYPDYIYNRNNKNEAFTYYLPITEFNILLKTFPSLDWKDLINNGSPKPYDILKNILLNLTFNDMMIFLKLYKLNFNDNNQFIFYILYNKNIESKDKCRILDSFTDDEINVKNKHNEGIIFKVIEMNDSMMFNYLLKRNMDLDYYCNNGYPIYNALYNDIINNNFTRTFAIYKKIHNNELFYTQIDKYLDNILSKILQTRLTTKKYTKNLDYSFDMEIIKNCSNMTWNQINIHKLTPFNYIIKLDYDIYGKMIKNIKINKTSKSLLEMNNYIDNRWKKHINTLDIIHDEIIKHTNHMYAHATLFRATFTDVSIYGMYLAKKYSNLYIPNMTSYMIKNTNVEENYSYPFADDIITREPIFPWIINYYSENEFYIHPYLNTLINTHMKSKYRFACVFLSVISDSYLHANILLYDFKNKTVERFEPYGYFIGLDLTIDNVLEEELTWNTGLHYIRPKDYLPYASFQMISDENNIEYKKPGDFGGFCLAWCIWYIENRMLNPNIEQKTVVMKLIKKLSTIDNKFIEYIRNYANKINKKRIEYYKLIGIKDSNISNLHINQHDEDKVIKFIIKSNEY